MWVPPDVSGIAPGYQQSEIADELLDGRLATIASGMPEHDAAITIHNRSAALRGARLGIGESLELPVAPYLHLFVARGQLTMSGADNGTELAEGDAVRFTAADGIRVIADQASEI